MCLVIEISSQMFARYYWVTKNVSRQLLDIDDHESLQRKEKREKETETLQPFSL